MSFSQFVRERQYLKNVSPATVAWYENSLRWLPCEDPTQEQLKETVIRMREKGLRATGCNSVIRAVNAYLRWTGSTLKIPPLKEPQEIMPTFTAKQVSLLAKWRPKNFYQRRLHLLVLILLDTGCRISEALSLRVCDVDLDNMLVTLDGKGHKQRIVPISAELRKHVFRYVRDFGRRPDALLLASRNETKLGRRVMLRDVKLLCKRLGFDPPKRTLHAFRHSFATNYLRRGGSVFHLQRCLGHSTLEMTRKYVAVLTEDLARAHERVSLLNAA